MVNLESLYTSASALALIDRVSEELDTKTELAIITGRQKQGLDSELVRFAVEQAVLRKKAQKKFGPAANQMLFTESGLEQATRSSVAAWHASLLRSAGIDSVTDIGCGIGADSIAFAKAGIGVVAIENNQPAFLAASHNLSPYSTAKVILENAESAQIATAALYLDPARREQKRSGKNHLRLDPKDFSPSLDFAFGLASKVSALIKLSPGLPHEMLPGDIEVNWVSEQGDLVEVLIRSGKLGKPGVRKAIMLGDEIHSFEGVQAEAKVRELGSYIFEPDSSLIRSHLLADFAYQNQLGLMSSGIAYLTADDDVASPWLKRYLVKDVLPLKEKHIRDYCGTHQIGTLEIKKRGIDITPEELRPKLRLKGTGAATLVLTKVGSARQAIVCEPIR